MRRISLTVQPEADFDVPNSDGYSVYAALLSVLQEYDADLSKHVHDSDFGTLHNSGLLGKFGDSDKRYHKTVRADNTYEVCIGVTDESDYDVFQALMEWFTKKQELLPLANGHLEVTSIDTSHTDHHQLHEEAKDLRNPDLTITFRSPTCILEAPDITTLFPHRQPVFMSILSKWNQSVSDDDLKFDFDCTDVKSSVIEKSVRTARTHNVVVNRYTDNSGEKRNIFRHGFSGKVTYGFRDAPREMQVAIATLAKYAEYSGIGSAVSRGCGNVELKIN